MVDDGAPQPSVLGTGGGNTLGGFRSTRSPPLLNSTRRQKARIIIHITSLFQGLFFAGYALGGTTGGVIASLILHSSGELEAEKLMEPNFPRKKSRTKWQPILVHGRYLQNETLRTCGIEGCPLEL